MNSNYFKVSFVLLLMAVVLYPKSVESCPRVFRVCNDDTNKVYVHGNVDEETMRRQQERALKQLEAAKNNFKSASGDAGD